MEIEVEVIQSVRFVKPLMKALDLYSKKKLSKACTFGSDKEKTLAMDLTLIKHIDSSVLGFLLELSRKLSKRKEKLVLFNLKPAIQGVLEMTKLNFLIQIEQSKESVIEKYT